jgi:HEAT repeat protein
VLLTVLLALLGACGQKKKPPVDPLAKKIRKLAKGLKSDRIRVRLSAVRDLADTGDERAVDPLMAYLGDADPEVRAEVQKALGRLAKHSFPRLVIAQKTSDTRLKSSALVALGRTRNPEARDLLRRELGGSCAAGAARGLAYLGEPALPALLGELGSTDSETRLWAIRALGMGRFQRAVSELVPIAAEGQGGARKAAITALGRIGDAKAVAALDYLLEDPDVNVMLAAAKALEKASGRKFKDVESWRSWYEKNRGTFKGDDR